MIALSQIDRDRFGVVTARDPEVSASSVAAALDFCKANGVQMLIARCGTEDITAAQALEDAGGRLMDTLVYWSRRLDGGDLPDHTCKVAIRPLRPGDEPEVRAVAKEAFRDYRGHYHADPRLDLALCDEVYASWAQRSCMSRDVAGEVLVADDGHVAGFVTFRRNDSQEGEVVLGGVAERAQGAGIYRSFIVEGMRWCQAQGVSRMVLSTQVTNLAVQKVWSRLGFEPSRSYYTFHLWLDGA